MDYVSIRVSTLRGDQAIDFDAYIKINDKYILYLRKGDSFEGARLKRLKEKKLKKMFITPDVEEHYRNYLKKNIEVAYDNNSSKSIETRSEIIQGHQQSNTEMVFENPEDQACYNETKKSAGEYVQFLMANSQAVSSVLKIENTDKNVAHHGVSVATLSVALAQKLKVDPKLISLLTLGALLHDIGHHDSPVNIQRKLSEMSPEDLKLYKTHPSVGSARVRDKKHFDQLVIKIINEHEESLDGKGYPSGLRENQLDPLSIIVSAANTFDRMITFENIPRQDAAKTLMIEKVGAYPLTHLQFLSEIAKTL
ncbi:MAG: HD domain-containing phosphohydrolase [Bdellovibrionota bacterium]